MAADPGADRPEAQPAGGETPPADGAPASLDAEEGNGDVRVAARRARVAAVAGWARVIVFAVAFALALRVFAFEAYRIPSTSMEDTLLVGDFVLVSKLHYGARVLGVRMPGFDDVDRGDVAVFNYPPSLDPVVGRRTPYIKRVVGLPGDTLAIRGKTVYVGDEAVTAPAEGRRLWELHGRLPTAAVLDALGLGGRLQRAGPGTWVASATRAEAERLAAAPGVRSMAPYLRPAGDGSAAFPAAARYSLDDYGPVVVPAAGMTMPLTDATFPVVRAVLERFEGRRVARTARGYTVDDRPAEAVTFGQDYYFVLGDSRDDSADSRTWGFVPFDHVIGRALGVYFSWDEAAGAPRWDRVGKGVGG